MGMMMGKWRHVSKPSVWKLKMKMGNSAIKALSLQSMPMQYQAYALKMDKDFLCLWSLLHFQTFCYYLTLNHGQKMTLLVLAIARSTSWLNIIWHFWKKKNWHDVTKISSKWTHLKTYIFPMLHNSPNESYLEIWHNNEVMAECQNIMHIFEILIIVSFKNAIVEHLFSQMNWVKTNFRNRLSRSRLDMCLRVGEEGPSIKDFELDHVINRWWTVKEWCLKSRPHNDPTKKASSFEFC